MLRRRALLVVRLGVLAALGGFSACTCGYTAGIRNETDSPVFANISSDWEGQRWEEDGVLIPPHGRTELIWTYDAFLRVRDMSGNTIAFRYLPEGHDVNLVVSSLEPLTDPEPLGSPNWAGIEGPSDWSTFVCRNGKWEEAQEFRTTITIRSNFNGPLIVSGFGLPSDARVSDELRGVLVPPMGEASLHLFYLEQGWIRAYDPQARLVFTKAVPKEPLPVVTIPASLPPEPEPIPTFDTSCEDHSGLTPTFVADAAGTGQ